MLKKNETIIHSDWFPCEPGFHDAIHTATGLFLKNEASIYGTKEAWQPSLNLPSCFPQATVEQME